MEKTKQDAISSLSKLIIFVFQPCLLFVNVASTLGNPGQSLSEIVVLPVFAVFQIFFGSLVGRVCVLDGTHTYYDRGVECKHDLQR